MKKLQIWCRVLLNYFGGFMQQSFDRDVDLLVKALISEVKNGTSSLEINTVTVDEYTIDFKSNDKIVASIWVANYPYAYGRFHFLDKTRYHKLKSFNGPITTWFKRDISKDRPSLSTIVALREFQLTLLDHITHYKHIRYCDLDNQLVDTIAIDSII